MEILLPTHLTAPKELNKKSINLFVKEVNKQKSQLNGMDISVLQQFVTLLEAANIRIPAVISNILRVWEQKTKEQLQAFEELCKSDPSKPPGAY